MDATQAMTRTAPIVAGLFDQLTPEDREKPSPCSEWNVHEVIEHMCGGGQMIAGALSGQAPPEDGADVLADGPVVGWAATAAALSAAATPDALAASHRLPFGEFPGEVALSVITADHLTHAWDVAKATGHTLDVDDELAQWALDTWKVVVPVDDREGPGFDAVVPVADDAPLMDQLAGYTGRRP